MSTQAKEQVVYPRRCSTEQRDLLARMAQEADRSLSAEIRRALTAHVERAHTEDGGSMSNERKTIYSYRTYPRGASGRSGHRPDIRRAWSATSGV